jgi:D-arabinose 1-dehydrogenase-like Zn-dependent alcohol dehydrogenase
VVEGDCILGHEAAGVVLKCGEGVTNLQPGTPIPRALVDYRLSVLLTFEAIQVAS